MATLDELHQALINADAAGDHEAAQALADHIRGMQAPPAPSPALQVNSPDQNWSNIGAENLQQAGIRPLTTNAQKIGGAALAAIPFNLGDEAGAGIKTLMGGNYDKELAYARDTQNRFSQEHPVANMALSMPGNIAATMALPGGPIVQGTAGGALQGFGGGEGGVGNRTNKAGAGAITGGLTALVASSVGKLLSQPNVSPDVKTLLDAKVPLTPGQILGGTAKKIEDRATSVPIIGDMISARQGDSIAGMNRAVADRALAPIGQTLPATVGAGRPTIAYVKKAMGDAYDAVLSKMSAHPNDPQFAGDMQTAITGAGSTLPPDQLAKFSAIVKAQIEGKFTKPGAAINGDTIKGIESELSKEIKGYSSGSWDDQKLAASLSDAQTAFRATLARQNPNYAPDLQKVNQAYANYAVLRRAGKAVGNDGGVFTPSQLQNAVQGADASAGKGSFASGAALMQDLSDPAKNVLPSKVPDSGTASRVWQGLAALTAGGTATHFVPGSAIPAAAALGTGIAAYTTPGQAFLRALLTANRPGGVAAAGQGLKLSAPALSAMLPALLRASSQ